MLNFINPAGNEPIREWLKSLSQANKVIVGQDLKTVEFGWPLGMPLVRKMEPHFWGVRSHLEASSIARVFFTIHDSNMVLLHGFIKKSTKTPDNDLKIAKERRNQVLRGEWL